MHRYCALKATSTIQSYVASALSSKSRISQVCKDAKLHEFSLCYRPPSVHAKATGRLRYPARCILSQSTGPRDIPFSMRCSAPHPRCTHLNFTSSFGTPVTALDAVAHAVSHLSMLLPRKGLNLSLRSTPLPSEGSTAPTRSRKYLH